MNAGAHRNQKRASDLLKSDMSSCELPLWTLVPALGSSGKAVSAPNRGLGGASSLPALLSSLIPLASTSRIRLSS